MKNTVERARALFPSEILNKEKTKMILDQLGKTRKAKTSPLWLVEKESILKALKMCKGNQSKVADILDIPRSSLHGKIREYNIDLKKLKNCIKKVCSGYYVLRRPQIFRVKHF